MTQEHFCQLYSNEINTFAREVQRLQQQSRFTPTARADLATAITAVLEIVRQYKQDYPQIGRELTPSLS
jgi:hypothetical protein